MKMQWNQIRNADIEELICEDDLKMKKGVDKRMISLVCAFSFADEKRIISLPKYH